MPKIFLFGKKRVYLQHQSKPHKLAKGSSRCNKFNIKKHKEQWD